MSRPEDLRLDALSVDVRSLLNRSVASLYSHLVTRPTGRAVRLAIEEQLKDLAAPALSLVDLSSVAILDYSCADEVVAKLLLGRSDRGARTFFLLRGVRPHHRDPIQAVLERHALAVVAETAADRFELMGSRSDGGTSHLDAGGRGWLDTGRGGRRPARRVRGKGRSRCAGRPGSAVPTSRAGPPVCAQ